MLLVSVVMRIMNTVIESDNEDNDSSDRDGADNDIFSYTRFFL